MSAYMRVPDHHHGPGVRCAGSGLQGQAGTEYIQCPACARHVRKVQPQAPDMGELMDRYQLTLQRGDVATWPGPWGCEQKVRAIGPGAAGVPGDWRTTTAQAVAAWFEQHAPRYDQQASQPQAPPPETSRPQQASRRLEGPAHVLPLDAQANVASEMPAPVGGYVAALPAGHRIRIAEPEPDTLFGFASLGQADGHGGTE